MRVDVQLAQGIRGDFDAFCTESFCLAFCGSGATVIIISKNRLTCVKTFVWEIGKRKQGSGSGSD